MLAALVRTGKARGTATTRVVAAVALFVYALAFSHAYVRLATATGALILFGAVQLTMIAAGLFEGERPKPMAWLGIVTAASGLVALTRPGLRAPDALGSALMGTAGIAWGVYSLLGRSALNPLALTARNFAIGAPLSALSWLVSASSGDIHASFRGIVLAIASGALASGVGYSLWYAALPHLTRTRAAVIQLSVPVLAAASAAAVLGEPVSLRLALSGAIILSGIGLVLRATRNRTLVTPRLNDGTRV
jgi:drug/metabolite transporter (DMT)-like permease